VTITIILSLILPQMMLSVNLVQRASMAQLNMNHALLRVKSNVPNANGVVLLQHMHIWDHVLPLRHKDIIHIKLF